jgi:hypothetical protein
MKSTALVTTVALAAAIFSVAASAQTGRPSSVEVQQSAEAPHVTANDQQLGSYARYLMLNGETRDEAVVAARNIDHPAARRVLAIKAGARADAQPPVRE